MSAALGPRPDMVPEEVPVATRMGRTLAKLTPSAAAAVDAAGSLVLVLITLVGLRTTFYGWTWLLVGVAGALLGLLCAHVGATYRWPAVLTASLVVVAYLVLGGPIAARDDLAVGVFPTGATFSDLVHVPVLGWKQMLTTVPPLDSSGPLLLLPFLIGLVGTALTYGVARRWRPAPLAVLVPVLLLGLSIALGTLLPASLLLQGVGFAVVAAVWASLRAHRNRPPLQNGAGRTSRLVTAGVLLTIAGLVGWFVGPMLPGAAAESRSVWRTDLQPPFDVSQFPSPLAGFRQYTEPNSAELYDQALLTVHGLPDGTPLRFAVLNSYNGSVWGATNDGSGGSASIADSGHGFRRVGSHIVSTGDGPEVSVQVTVPEDGYRGVWVPTAGDVSGIDFTGPRADDLADELRYNTDLGTAVLPTNLQAGDGYTLDLHETPAPPEDLPQQVDTATGSPVDTGSLTFLDTALDKWGGNDPNPWGQLRSVAHHMRDEGAYTDGDPTNYERAYLPGHSLGRLTRFLAASQLAGDDEQYAATLALVASRLDIPARVVFGALPKGDVVRGKDIHAWVEVQRADGSWLTILPSQFVPRHNKKPKQQQRRSEEKRVGALVPPPATNNPPSVLQGPDQAQNDTQVKKRHHDENQLDPRNWPRWVQLLVLLVGLPLVLFLLAYAALVLAKVRRRRLRRTRGSTAQRFSGGWHEVVDTARELRIPVTRRATRFEQARELEPVLGSAPMLAGAADRFVFGDVDPEQAQVDAYWADIGRARGQLRSGRGWWRRRRADLTARPGRWQDKHEQQAALRASARQGRTRRKVTAP